MSPLYPREAALYDSFPKTFAGNFAEQHNRPLTCVKNSLKISPLNVGVTPSCPRTNKTVENSSSNSCMAREITERETNSSSAAAVMFPVRQTASKYSICLFVILISAPENAACPNLAGPFNLPHMHAAVMWQNPPHSICLYAWSSLRQSRRDDRSIKGQYSQRPQLSQYPFVLQAGASISSRK